MSTKLPRTPRSLSVLLMVGWMVACAGTYEISNTSGGGTETSHAAQIVAGQVAEAVRLTPSCALKAQALAESSMRARVATWRPTHQIFAREQEKALQEWKLGRCPDRALPGIAWGTAHYVRERMDDRLYGGLL